MANRRDPWEEEFRNSTVYHVMGKMAEGLGRAAAEWSKNRGGPRYYNQVNPPEPPEPETPPPPPPVDYRQAPENHGYRYQGNRSSQKEAPDGSYHYVYRKAKPSPVEMTVKKEKRRRAARNWMRFGFPALAAISYGSFSLARLHSPNWIFLLTLVLAAYLAGEICGRIAFPVKKEKKEKKAQAQEPPVSQEEKKEVPPAPQPDPIETTGNPELDKIIREGNDYIKKLRAANDAIPDEGVSQSIDRMEAASKGIFEYVREHPAQIPQIKKFMNYYLPTTLKLLNSYDRLSRQAVKGENISATLFDIEGMMQTIATAFEKQLDGLFSAEAMDIQADITVFETILEQEGLKEEESPAEKS